VAEMADRVAVMYLGRIVESGRVDEIMRTPLHPYTQALLSAIPVARLDGQGQMIRLAGEPPSPASPPSGCHFHPRCPQAMGRCRSVEPEATAVTRTHTVVCHLHSPDAIVG